MPLKAGVCLTFDDLFVDNWCAALSVFARFDAVATFCVARLHEASEAQRKGLHMLQDAGHEIAYHSRTHPKLKPYLNAHGVDHWLAHEIDAGCGEHRQEGFPATSFAAPFHASTPKTRKATGQRFAICRNRGPRGIDATNAKDRVYRQLGKHKSVDNIGSLDFCHKAHVGWAPFLAVLDVVKDQSGVGVFTGHDIRPHADGAGFYLTQDDLIRALDAIRARDLHFYTLSGFAESVGGSGE